MLRQILLNGLLAIVWMVLTNELSLTQLVVGYLLGAGVLEVLHAALGTRGYLARAYAVADLARVFAIDVILANVNVAAIVLGPALAIRPGIVALPLDLETDFEITTLAGMITLTPGTLALEVSGDRRTLYVHALDIPDPEALRRRLKARLERRILAVTGPVEPGGG